ncbi:MAG: efflux RND transporter periplasmic adaptor subunit [Kofleriaceae bacterium]
MVIATSLQPDPPRQQDNRVQVDVSTSTGAPIEGAEVTVTYHMPAMGSMPEMKSTFPATAAGTGRYRASFDLPMGGSWSLIVAVTAGNDAATARYAFTVGTAGLKIVDEGGPAAANEPPPPPLPATTFTPEARAAFAGGMAPYDTVRRALGEGRMPDPATATALARAIRATRAAMPADRAERSVIESLEQSARAADRVASAGDLTAARLGFAQLNRQWMAMIARAPDLVDGWRTMECAMAPDFGQWLQRDTEPSNPYIGETMVACVSEASPAAAVDTNDDIQIDPGRRQIIGIGTAAVTRGPLDLALRAVGRVTYDETRVRDVTSRVSGFVTDLRVAATGRAVTRGEILFTLYSPDLYAAQQEYLLARQQLAATAGPRSDALLRAASTKLRLWGMSDKQLTALVERGEPIENVPYPAPASGYVVENNLVEGASVAAGARLFRIAALDKIWVEADVFEPDLARIHRGDQATVTLDAQPGDAVTGKVALVYPYLDPATRTGRVRVELPNRGLGFKPDMFATVTFHVTLADRTLAPASAVVYTGLRRLVFVDVGGGRLRPREVTTGARTADQIEIVTGLSPGDLVVTAGNFLVAAESRIRSTALWEDAP